MEYRTLGRTGLRVSAIAFGAGPVSGLMTGGDHAAQTATLRRAIERGINWIDTAPGYGQGTSEANVGRALGEIGRPADVHVATKVRLAAADVSDVRGAVRRSVEQSLRRLGRPQVTLLQLHNGLTAGRDDEPFSITPADVLRPGGVLEAFRELQTAGAVRFLGLTGTGQPVAMREVVQSGGFDTIQVPYHLLNPSAGRTTEDGFADTDYGNIIADGAAESMGVFAIRVFAGGALLGQEPSAHTLKTPFFPLTLYERDRQRARELAGGGSLKESALWFVLGNDRVSAAIVGFGGRDEVDEVCDLIERKTPG
jgi:aryl-alcohol dehydrogenase-like predicted oxidoreductase